MVNLNRDILAAVLSEMRKTYPDAIIAGGSCRDIVLGRPSKDIDVFTSMAIDPELLMHPKSVEEYQASGGRILGVTNPFEMACSPIPVQVISIAPPDATKTESCVEQFCFGLNQAWFSGGGIEVTPAFEKDANGKHITVTYCWTPFEAARLLSKFKSMQGRYDWPLVIPEDGPIHLLFQEAEAMIAEKEKEA